METTALWVNEFVTLPRCLVENHFRLLTAGFKLAAVVWDNLTTCRTWPSSGFYVSWCLTCMIISAKQLCSWETLQHFQVSCCILSFCVLFSLVSVYQTGIQLIHSTFQFSMKILQHFLNMVLHGIGLNMIVPSSSHRRNVRHPDGRPLTITFGWLAHCWLSKHGLKCISVLYHLPDQGPYSGGSCVLYYLVIRCCYFWDAFLSWHGRRC